MDGRPVNVTVNWGFAFLLLRVARSSISGRRDTTLRVARLTSARALPQGWAEAGNPHLGLHCRIQAGGFMFHLVEVTAMLLGWLTMLRGVWR